MGRRTRLYMAYGSNMNLEQMADRCRTAEVVGKGILKNYELLFRGARHDGRAAGRKQCSGGALGDRCPG